VITDPPTAIWDFDGPGAEITITLLFPNDMNTDVKPPLAAIAVDFNSVPFTIDSSSWIDTHQFALVGASGAPPAPPVNVVLAIWNRDLRLHVGYAQSPFSIVAVP